MPLKTSRRRFHQLLLSAGATCLLDLPLHAQTPSPQGVFIHPGMLHTAVDLDRMRAAVDARQQPIFSGFQKLEAHPASQKTYTMQGPFPTISRSPTVHAEAFNLDANASYQCAILWKVTGDRAYFDVASRILNAWGQTLTSIGGVDAILCAGLGPFLMANAAELLRHGGQWSVADSQRFGRMLRQAVLPVLENFAAFANGNWDTAALKTMLAIAIYTEDRPLFDRALTYYCHGAGDGRLANYIYPSGQCQESGRDQQHTQLGIAHLGDCCEMAWNQGIDLYGWLDNRLLAGFEYTARYNLGEDVPFTPDVDRTGKYRHQVISPRGSFRPIYEQIYNHYVHRRGLPAPFTKRAAEQIRPEGAGFQADQTGFGTLLYTRPAHSPLPATGTPAALYAEPAEGATRISFIPPASNSAVCIQRSEHPAGPFITIASAVPGTSYLDTSAKPARLYFYRVVATGRASSPIAHMPSLPQGWQQDTLGLLPGQPTASFDGQSFRLTAARASNPGGLFFVHRPLGQNATMTARLTPPIASQFLRTGIAVANSTLCASLLISPTSGPAEHPRWTASLQTPNATQGSVPIPSPAVENGRIMAPVWLRLRRAATTLEASISVDGVTWLPVGTVEVPSTSLRIGLALDSGLPGVETTLTFDQITFKTGN